VKLSRKPALLYSRALHTGSNDWDVEPRFGILGGIPTYWITRNGERVDMTPLLGRAYYTGDPDLFITSQEMAEANARRLAYLLRDLGI
jgi:hypothetical protein